MVGITFNDVKIDTEFYTTYGWFFYCYSSTLFSGPPHKYFNKSTKLPKVKNEIIVKLNLKKRSLTFVIDNNEEESFTNIPLDKIIVPAILLYHENDSVEIDEI